MIHAYAHVLIAPETFWAVFAAMLTVCLVPPLAISRVANAEPEVRDGR